ncbi:hypothetical protein ABL78_1592 [Leptomonas seymouri]|uniref:Uncharacterized protein n=1 Tax=Leptomonas seymouri TaxID=5684 RepID=A0A0N0P7W4_LEPSE|nr:hypothetical protein ABL78_1592 [Leptomonas seymouri]|eukprot:KPI89259.1 hypothetical protein ABL78_1592 [Leptomonas seymouri]
MSNLLQRLFLQVLTKLGSESAVIQRAAQKAARTQHHFTHSTVLPASEKAGVWLGAAAREVYLDVKAATSYLKGESPQSESDTNERLHGRASTAAGPTTQSKKESGQQRPFH